LLDLYTLISTRYSGSAYAQRATGLTAALKERMKPAVDSSLVSRADTTGVPLDREADIAVEQKETIPSISERRREDAEEAVVPGVQRPAEALERDLFVRPPTVADTTTYDIADVEPRLVGGDGALQRMFRYPETAAEGQVSGRVELRFVVDERGRILEPSIADSVGAGCDEEALRVIRLSRFRPATIDGRAVRYRMVLDVNCAPDPRP
jgi:protein TonB